MATAELARPGVEVIQKIRTSSPTFLRPTLAPVIVGPAFEVIDVLTADGTINSKALLGAYAQFGQTVPASAFPNPRGNVDELVIDNSSVTPYLYTGGRLRELPIASGSAFLKASHQAAGTVLKVAGNSFNLDGTNLILAVDQQVSSDPTRDVTVAFTGSNPWTASRVVSAINSAFGFEVAFATTAPIGFELVSPTKGAASSLTIRSGGSANQALGLGWTSNGEEWRVEGSGYRAFDLSNNSQVSTWVEFFRGDFSVNGSSVGGGAWSVRAFLRPLSGSDLNARQAAITFTGVGAIPLAVGDQFYADGILVKGAEISRVDNTKFKLGTINTGLSTADENGQYTRKVYDEVELTLPLFSGAFAPKYVWFKASALSSSAANVAFTSTGANVATAATSADVVAQGNPPSLPITLQGLTIDYVVTVGGVSTTDSYVFTESSPFTSVANIAASISIPGVAVSTSGGSLRFTTSARGAAESINILTSGTANPTLGILDALYATGTDDAFSGLAGLLLRTQFDDGAHVYETSFTTDSLDDAIERINSVAGAVVASKNDSRQLVLTSPLAGVASKVVVLDGDAATLLGFGGLETSISGSGRPSPDAYFNDGGVLVLGSGLLRDPVTGYPLDFTTSRASIYVQYKGLRLDVSPLAKQAGTLRIPDVTTLTQVLDPVDERNPLAFGMYLAMLNCPNFEVKGLGVDEISALSPEGTELAYARAASFLEAEEVYAIAPLTHNEVVHSTFQTHVTLMSEPEMGGERIVFYNKKIPSYASPVIAASGSAIEATGTINQLLIDVTPQQGLADAGVDSTQNIIPVSDGVYVEFSYGGVFYRYSVSQVQGGLLTLRTSFTAGQNDDYFYTVAAVPSSVSSNGWALKVRGDALVVPGSTVPDYALISDTVAEANTGTLNRRVYSVFPDTVKTVINGLEKSLPGYYSCAAIAGMVAGLPPAQGFTNYPITGLTGLVGVERYTRRQLNKMAGGGTYVLMQEVQGGPVFSRHQLSTDTTSVETRELSITKVVDFVAKFLRVGIRRFIGRQNISAVFLDTVGTTIQGMLTFLTENGIINGANLNNIIQDPKAPDTVMVDVTLDIPYPCNYIRLTLVV